eukprot:g2048.t1
MKDSVLLLRLQAQFYCDNLDRTTDGKADPIYPTFDKQSVAKFNAAVQGEDFTAKKLSNTFAALNGHLPTHAVVLDLIEHCDFPFKQMFIELLPISSYGQIYDLFKDAGVELSKFGIIADKPRDAKLPGKHGNRVAYWRNQLIKALAKRVAFYADSFGGINNGMSIADMLHQNVSSDMKAAVKHEAEKVVNSPWGSSSNASAGIGSSSSSSSSSATSSASPSNASSGVGSSSSSSNFIEISDSDSEPEIVTPQHKKPKLEPKPDPDACNGKYKCAGEFVGMFDDLDTSKGKGKHEAKAKKHAFFLNAAQARAAKAPAVAELMQRHKAAEEKKLKQEQEEQAKLEQAKLEKEQDERVHTAAMKAASNPASRTTKKKQTLAQEAEIKTQDYAGHQYPDSDVEDSTSPDNLYTVEQCVQRSILLNNKYVARCSRSSLTHYMYLLNAAGRMHDSDGVDTNYVEAKVKLWNLFKLGSVKGESRKYILYNMPTSGEAAEKFKQSCLEARAKAHSK